MSNSKYTHSFGFTEFELRAYQPTQEVVDALHKLHVASSVAAVADVVSAYGYSLSQPGPHVERRKLYLFQLPEKTKKLLPAGPSIVSSASEYTGGSVDYYQVSITKPTTPGRQPYIAECNDIIEALGMNYAQATVFKAVWRMCAALNLNKLKKGNNELYDAEKIVFFGQRLVTQFKQSNQPK